MTETETETIPPPPEVVHVPAVSTGGGDGGDADQDEDGGDDDEEENVELHAYILILKEGLPPLSVWDTEDIDAVSQRVKSERGRKGDVRFPAKGRLYANGDDDERVQLPVCVVEAKLIAATQEIFADGDDDEDDDDDDDDEILGGITIRRGGNS